MAVFDVDTSSGEICSLYQLLGLHFDSTATTVGKSSENQGNLSFLSIDRSLPYPEAIRNTSFIF